MSHSSRKSNRSSAPRPLPKHTALKVARNGVFAHAPYNFVPLPEKIVPAQSVPDQDRYQGNTGWIDCDLETLTPLYVRGMMTTTAFAEGDADRIFADLTKKAQQERARFFSIEDRVIIPGSSLRGMIRALVEIAAFGKVGPVGAEQRFFYRAVAAPVEDPLGKLYKHQMKSGSLKAGYLESIPGSDSIFIRPARKVNGGQTFILAKETDKRGYPANIIDSSLQYKVLNRPDYTPQYVRVSYSYKTKCNGRVVAERVSKPDDLSDTGWMVCSGNMAESGKGNSKSPRRNHTVVPDPDPSAALIPIRQSAVEDYLAALTDFQSKEPFDSRKGCLVMERPVFYIDDGKEVIAFGHTRNFRLPFLRSGQRRASTALDFVPAWLRDEEVTDMAEAIFGYVKSNAMEYGKQRACAGRVFVGDAVARPDQGTLIEATVTPRILASPKPSTFQHYLTQPDEAAQNRSHLKHYASPTPDETVIRGHKLYWHRKGIQRQDYVYQGSAEDREKHKKQLTGIQPVRAGARFTFRVRFENLTDEELGALLWALELPAGCAHKLGMGKPLGLGSARVTVTDLRLTDRPARYSALFSGDQWEDGARADASANAGAFKDRFEKYVLAQMAQEDRNGAGTLAGTPRIGELLRLLSYDNAPPLDKTLYMAIEPKNEYSERPVLPLPSSVMSSGNSATARSSAPKPGPVAGPAPVSPPRPAQKPAAASGPAPARERKPGDSFAATVIEEGAGYVILALQGVPPEKERAKIVARDIGGQPLPTLKRTVRCEVIDVQRLRDGAIVYRCRLAPAKGAA